MHRDYIRIEPGERELQAKLDAHFPPPRYREAASAPLPACRQGRQPCTTPHLCALDDCMEPAPNEFVPAAEAATEIGAEPRLIPSRGDGIERGAFSLPLIVLALIALACAFAELAAVVAPLLHP